MSGPPRGLPPETVAAQAEMLANRVKKNARRLAPIFARRSVGAYRLYDWDIPEIRAVVDWYEGHLVVSEYARALTDATDDWVGTMARAAGAALGLAPEKVFTRRRQTRPAAGPRYGKIAERGERLVVREGDLRFVVNLSDYLDTGLFAHHRETRARVRAESEGRAVLNLYGYTGAFTCAAAAGGAPETLTVDASARYLEWARENLELNGFGRAAHQLVKAEVRGELQALGRRGRRFDLAIVDPPSFSDRGPGGRGFDVVRDHRGLLVATLAVVRPGGVVWFATNHARFVPDLEGLEVAELVELTEETQPIDFRRPPHRVWRMVRR